MSRHPAYRTAAETARRLGVTVRALRVYERHGLVRPGRTAAGWRVYGPEEHQRLHEVLALKRLGLTLSQIAALLKGRAVDLDRVLAMQEEELALRKRHVDRALTLVRRARARLAKGDALPTDDLIELTKETVMSDFKPGPEFQALVDKHVDIDRVKQAHPGGWTGEDQARASAEWAALIAEAERLKDGDPGSAEALDLCRRWNAMVGQFTKGDAQLGSQVGGMYREGFANPQTASQMPCAGDVWAFIGEAQKRLKAAGG